jgi:hypothetical protein
MMINGHTDDIACSGNQHHKRNNHHPFQQRVPPKAFPKIDVYGVDLHPNLTRTLHGELTHIPISETAVCPKYSD